MVQFFLVQPLSGTEATVHSSYSHRGRLDCMGSAGPSLLAPVGGAWQFLSKQMLAVACGAPAVPHKPTTHCARCRAAAPRGRSWATASWWMGGACCKPAEAEAEPSRGPVSFNKTFKRPKWKSEEPLTEAKLAVMRELPALAAEGLAQSARAGGGRVRLHGVHVGSGRMNGWVHSC